MTKWIIINILLLNLPFQAAIARDWEKADIREECRRTISGMYLKSYDEMRQAKEYVLLLKKKLKDLNDR